MLLTTKKALSLWDNKGNQDKAKLTSIWENLNIHSCPRDYNFHLHTHCSDGQLTPESLVEQAISIGLQGFAITDHHSVKGFYRAKNYLSEKFNFNNKAVLPHLWTGIEITSKLNGTIVHLLGYGFNPKAEILQKYLTGEAPTGNNAEAKNVIKTIHQANGLVVLAHPSRYRRNAQELMEESYALGIDGLETYYAYGNPNPWQSSDKQTALVKKMADKYNLYTTCGTDTHGSNILVKL